MIVSYSIMKVKYTKPKKKKTKRSHKAAQFQVNDDFTDEYLQNNYRTNSKLKFLITMMTPVNSVRYVSLIFKSYF